jgi:predicted nucleic acid-binding protein
LKVFIDSNIPMYVAGAAHPNRDPARTFLERVQVGEVEGCASTEVLQEILYRYTAIGRRDLARSVYDLFVSVCRRVPRPVGQGLHPRGGDAKPWDRADRDLR